MSVDTIGPLLKTSLGFRRSRTRRVELDGAIEGIEGFTLGLSGS